MNRNVRKLIVYLRNLSDKNNFLFLFFIFGDIFFWWPQHLHVKIFRLGTTMICPKKISQQGAFVISLQTGFFPLLNVHFNDIQTNRCLYLSTSLQGIPFSANFLKKEQTRKTSFYGNNELNCISCSMVCKTLFCSGFHNILVKSRLGTKTDSEAIAKPHSLQGNVKSLINKNSMRI